MSGLYLNLVPHFSHTSHTHSFDMASWMRPAQLPLTRSARELPMTMSEQRARVSPTLMRRSSATKPMLPGRLPLRTDLRGSRGRGEKGAAGIRARWECCCCAKSSVEEDNGAGVWHSAGLWVRSEEQGEILPDTHSQRRPPPRLARSTPPDALQYTHVPQPGTEKCPSVCLVALLSPMLPPYPHLTHENRMISFSLPWKHYNHPIVACYTYHPPTIPHLTHENKMMSFSLPWKPSMVLMSTMRAPSSPSACAKLSRSSLTCDL